MLRTLGFALAAGLLLAACPGGASRGSTVKTAGGAGPAHGGGPAHGPKPAGGGGGSSSPGDPSLAAGTTCPAPGCVFHGGLVGGAYFACLSSGAGACFHFGARCAPADGCMFEAASQQYKHCDDAVEGTCGKYGATCTPASACAFNAADGLHHTCESWTDGRCGRWGALCAP